MNKMFLDIETLPADESKTESLRYLYTKKLEKKAKKKEMIGEVEVEEGDAKFEDYFRNTSFDGAYGRVLCIAYAFGDGPTEVICNPDDEAQTLRRFWELARNASLFVGHNIMDFDLRFLYQRSTVLGVRPSVNVSFARYKSAPIFDTMREWVKWSNNNVGLEHLALALGIPTPKDGIDGSQVFEFYQAGKIDDICEYCKRDVDVTRLIYKRMVFEN